MLDIKWTAAQRLAAIHRYLKYQDVGPREIQRMKCLIILSGHALNRIQKVFSFSPNEEEEVKNAKSKS
jgi:hypothetical protein